MSKTNYEDLMSRYVQNEVTEEERVRIEAWLDMLVDRNTRDLHLTPDEQEALYQKIVSKEDNLAAIRAYKPKSMMRNIRGTWVMRIAAGVAILLCVSYVLLKMNSDSQRFSSPDKMILTDGTIVWLGSGSKLQYEDAGNTRQAELVGEGLFEVAKDATKPFILTCEGLTIRVVGTSFNVKTGDQIEIKVLTGIVKVTTEQDTLGVTLMQNDGITYNPTTGLLKTEIKPEEVTSLVAHTQYSMRFNNTTLNEVVERIEKKFDVDIQLENSEAGECHVNIDITDNSLENSLKKIAAILNVEYKIDGSAITLTGTGCK